MLFCFILVFPHSLFAESTTIELIQPFPGQEQGIVYESDRGAIGIMEAYVSSLFLFGSGIVTLVAILWIMIGGYEIMFKGSFAGSVEDGKQKILNALLGIVLLLLSALILHTVNPGFFQLGSPPPEDTPPAVPLTS